MYSLFRKLVFTLNPERAHHLALQSLQSAYRTGLLRFYPKAIFAPHNVMGLTFANQIGLSAGFDRNADYIDALAQLGFGFIEIGTVVPLPQSGNPLPRIFRLVEQEALINRVGFASKGLAYVRSQLEKTHYTGILGINIGKNKMTPNHQAVNDYLLCFRALWKFASYITINLSSPNTTGLRELLKKEALSPLLFALKQEQDLIFKKEKKYVPLVVKISPDLSDIQITELVEVLLQQRIDGIISANTTLSRETINSAARNNTTISQNKLIQEMGGLSGRPLTVINLNLITKLHNLLNGRIPIIASGGIMDETCACEAVKAGASLLQIYTGLIFKGPYLIKRLASLDLKKK